MSKLAQILEDQLADARKRAGTPIIRTLGRGLRVQIECVSNDVQLTLTRFDQFPSVQEWNTVLKHFPYQVPKVEPQTERKGSRFTISARFPSERTIQAKFF